jgi:4-diphosphocytidyl-2-C-methyl-D-erythritol kinase
MTDPTRRLMPVVRLAPAKLNLTLAVVGRRTDGYHALHSVMAPLELADRLSLAPTGRHDTLHVAGPDTGPAAENLVLRAIAAARDAAGPVGPLGGRGAPLAARLEKVIPVAAGLAGGSSDAAAALDGALEAWGATLDPVTRDRVAARIGSDVPFFLAGGIALVEGRGERVTPLPDLLGSSPGLLLVTPRLRVATPAVFAAFAAGARPETLGSARLSSSHLAAELGTGLTAGALVDRAGILAAANDLVPATGAVVPSLVPFRRLLTRRLRRPIGQSGSGPTLWALYPSIEAAEAARSELTAAIAAGEVATPGDGPPTVVATTIRSRGTSA